MSSISWQYIAGFFDGEGSICTCSSRIPRPHYPQGGISWQCHITQSYEPVLIEIKDFLAIHGIKSSINHYEPRTNAKIKSQKTIYNLHILGGREGLSKFLKFVFPYLIVKKTIAQDLLRTMIICPPLRGLTRTSEINSDIKFRYLTVRESVI